VRAGENSTRWIVRDLGVFLYGCIFAGQCILKRRISRDSEKRTVKHAPVLVIQRRNLRIA
jgi:hypothetical protein